MQVTKQFEKHTKALLLKVNTEKDFRSIMTATLTRVSWNMVNRDWPCFQNNGKYFLHMCEHIFMFCMEWKKILSLWTHF